MGRAGIPPVKPGLPGPPPQIWGSGCQTPPPRHPVKPPSVRPGRQATPTPLSRHPHPTAGAGVVQPGGTGSTLAYGFLPSWSN